jgi:hypothetical protein
VVVFLLLNAVLLFIIKECQPARQKPKSPERSMHTSVYTGNIQGKIQIPAIILSCARPAGVYGDRFQKLHLETRTQIDREFGNQLKNKELLKKLLIAQIATVWALYIMWRTSPCFFFISYYFLYHQRPECATKTPTTLSQ